MFNGVLPFHVSCTDCWYDKGRCMNLSTIFYLIMPMTLGYFSFVRWRKSNLDLTKDNATEHPWLASTHPQASSSDELRRVRTSSASAMITTRFPSIWSRALAIPWSSVPWWMKSRRCPARKQDSKCSSSTWEAFAASLCQAGWVKKEQGVTWHILKHTHTCLHKEIAGPK